MSNLWTVTLHEGRKTSRVDGKREGTVEYCLQWEGRPAHCLTGERGKTILEEFADELNARNYVPRFEEGKMITELSQAQRTKLAQLQSPPLPLE